MEETLDEYYKIGNRYTEIGVLVDLVTCFAKCRDSDEICKTKCGGVLLFGSLKNRPICGYNCLNTHEFEEL